MEDWVLEPNPPYKPSSCSPIFHMLYDAFGGNNVNAVIHLHSKASVLVTLIYDKEFRISDFEQIKAFKTGDEHMANFETLVIPIMENRPTEDALAKPMEQVVEAYPKSCAVLVRRHGLFVWAEDIWRAKIYAESLEYLFEITVEMSKLGLLK